MSQSVGSAVLGPSIPVPPVPTSWTEKAAAQDPAKTASSVINVLESPASQDVPCGQPEPHKPSTGANADDLHAWLDGVLEAPVSEADSDAFLDAIRRAAGQANDMIPAENEEDKGYKEWSLAAKGGKVAMQGTAPGNAFYARLRRDPDFSERWKKCKGPADKKVFRDDFFQRPSSRLSAPRRTPRIFGTSTRASLNQ